MLYQGRPRPGESLHEGGWRRRLIAPLALAFAATAFIADASAQQRPDLVTPDVLRVCSDPANLPFSNRAGEGFENRIAAVLADELKSSLRYYWLSQGPGFVRNTLGAKLCDVIIGQAAGSDVAQHSNPYYRSVYAMLVRRGGPLDGVDRLSDPRLAGRSVGVVAATPPVDHLAAQGMLEHTRTYALLVDRRYDSPADTMVADLLGGSIEAAILWGPLAGDLARRHPELTLVPLLHETARPPLVYRIALGLRPDETDWKHTLNLALHRRQAEITRILLGFDVPLLDDDDRLISAKAEPPPEPDGYRREGYRAPTPATLKGATVLDNHAAEALWRQHRAAFVDVMPQPKRPAELAPGTLWRDTPHPTIPGATWLTNTGFGDLAPETEAYFVRGLAAATAGDRAHPLVIFCQRACWMSWNAAKRALKAGYTAVFWYPDGTDGWSEAGLPLERAEPAP
jgi:quinoprotein dehydrogenase-associated probable ABC transporter substrate-binding protein/PQQ-dependent catabolism-associated CXXCW motif protein